MNYTEGICTLINRTSQSWPSPPKSSNILRYTIYCTVDFWKYHPHWIESNILNPVVYNTWSFDEYARPPALIANCGTNRNLSGPYLIPPQPHPLFLCTDGFSLSTASWWYMICPIWTSRSQDIDPSLFGAKQDQSQWHANADSQLRISL